MVESAVQQPKILCISTYEKGQAFLREAARLGCAVTLLTVEKLAPSPPSPAAADAPDARRAGVAVPEFCSVANHHALWGFMQRTGGPWLLKPRWSASAIGIQKIEHEDEVWPHLERLGDEASNHLLEQQF